MIHYLLLIVYILIAIGVTKVRDELEHLLDDDNDMAEMYLTEKLVCFSLDCTLFRESCNNEIEVER